MVGDIDLVVMAAASNSFLPIGTSGIDRKGYDRMVAGRGLKRTLLDIGCGSTPDPNANIDSLMVTIDKATGSNMQRLGAICLFGTSNGSGQTLGLAKALQQRGASLSYVGVGDLTMIPFGRNPPIKGIGNLQPTNPPEVGLGLKVGAVGAAAAAIVAVAPSVSGGKPPEIADPGITAATRENYFTTQGNRARVTARTPVGVASWWWTSSQKFGEVHGKIPGWDNIPHVTTSTGSVFLVGVGSIDEGHHDDLCGFALPKLTAAAQKALEDFILLKVPSF